MSNCFKTTQVVLGPYSWINVRNIMMTCQASHPVEELPMEVGRRFHIRSWNIRFNGWVAKEMGTNWNRFLS